VNNVKQWEHDLTVKEAMELFRCSKPTIYRLLRDGELEAYRVNAGRICITKESIDKMRKQPCRN